MVSAKDRVINSLKPQKRRFPRGKTKLGSVGYDNPRDDIESAKHLREGTIQHTPANPKDIVNKEYADSAGGGGWTDDGLTVRLSTASDSVGIGTADPDGKVHIFEGTAGNVTANVNADGLVVEDNTDTGISILSPDGKFSNLFFGAASSNTGALIRWKHSTKIMQMGTNFSASSLQFLTDAGVLALDIDSSQNFNFQAGDLTTTGDIIVGGTVDGVDIAARDHAESHTIASHSDTTGTGAELNTLTDGSETTLHSHAGGGGGGGWVDDGAVVRLETIGDDVGIGTTSPDWKLDVEDSGNNVQAKFGNSKGIYLGGLDPIIGLNLYKNFGDNKFGKGSSTSYASSINFSTSSGDLSFLTSNATGDADDAASMNTILTLSQNKTVRIHGALHLIGSAPEPPEADTLYKENICKAWINFNSSGTIAIRDSFNVSGITDHGTGDYTVTWDTDFADANYGVWVTRRQHSLGSNLASTGIHSSVNPVVSSVRILQESSDANGNSVRTEGDIMMVIAFGAQ